MSLDFDLLARVYHQVCDGREIPEAIASVKANHGAMGRTADYEAAIPKVQKLVSDGHRWPAAVQAVAIGETLKKVGDRPKLEAVQASVAKKKAKKTKKK